MNKRILSLVLALVMVIGSFGFVSAQTGNEKVDWLIEEGLVLGDSRGYRLNDPIRRSEVATMVTRALDAESSAELLKGIASAFSDVPVNHWANGYVNYATSMQYVNGYPDGTFRPDRNISYAEIIAILVRTTDAEVNTEGYTGSFWATPYIIEAIELGITEGVVIPNSDYNAAATREKVFEMIYNTVMERLLANREVYKAIFVENDRIGSLDENEIEVVIFGEGSNSPDATLRYEKDDEVTLVLASNMDSEMLLGKVADITIDKNDNVIAAVVDTSYDYHAGPFAAMDLEIMLNTGDYYDVLEEASSSRSIEKLYGVYLNEEAQDYPDYVIDNDDSDGTRDGAFVAEFARVTVKDNVVFFIESYMFEDIAPVVRVEDDGEEVVFLDDSSSANEDSYFIDKVVGITNGEFHLMELSEISAGNVVHVYGDSALVRTDAQFTGEYERVRESDDVFYAEIDDVLYQIRSTSNKRPVYSLDGVNYFTLNDVNAANNLEDLEGTDVAYFLDANNSLQRIGGEIEYSEHMILIEDSGTRDITAIMNGGNQDTFRTDNFSVLLRRNPSGSAGIDDFDRGSIAYLINDGSLIDRITRVATPEYIADNAEDVLKDSRDRFDINLSQMTISTEEATYNYNSKTNIFIVNVEGDVATRIDSMSMEDVVDMADTDSTLKAFVVTNAEFMDLSLGNEAVVEDSVEVAHTIVFTDLVLDDEFVETEILQLEYSYNPTRDQEITGMNSDGDSMDFNVAEFAVLPSMSSGEIVELVIEDGEVIAADVLLDDDSPEYEVTSISIRDERISLDGDEFWLAEDYIVFGDTTVREDDTVSVVFNPEVDVEVEIILVR